MTGSTDFPGFSALFESPPAAADPDPSATARDAVAAALAPVAKAQDTYQPIYGARDGGLSPREQLLRDDVALVEAEFANVLRKDQVRIIDMGCNAGFVSFALSETFPNTVGLDINRDNLALCRALKAQTGARARFYDFDLMGLVERNEADLDQVDCVLLLNIVHQLIFARGVPYVQDFIARLAARVDFMVVELATRADYVPFGRDKQLPLVPAEILAGCTDSTITLVKQGKRPVYTLRRRRIAVAGEAMDFSTRDFSLHINPRVSRKYYYGANRFVKMMRYNTLQREAQIRVEATTLEALSSSDVAPRLIGWESGDGSGRICMERLYGAPLIKALPQLDAGRKAAFFREAVRIAAVLAEKKIFQNDFSAHNLLIMSDGSLRMIDFEQVGPRPTRDPFGFILWLANDLERGRPESYAREIYKKIVLQDGATRTDTTHYPEARSLGLGSEIDAVYREARDTTASWPDFIRLAHKRLAAS